MQLILLKSIRKLGKIGEIVTVKNGYGRNYLIPQGLALRANNDNLAVYEAKKQELEVQNQENAKVATQLAKKLEGKDFTFIKQASDDGRLFGSVSSKDIATEVAKISANVIHSDVVLPNPLKALGVYKVSVALHADVLCEIIINIGRSSSEAQEALRLYKASNEKITPDADESLAEDFVA